MAPDSVVVLIQPSSVKSLASRFQSGLLLVKIWSSTPSRLKACPTSPAAKVAPFCSVPLLLPRKSFAFPSAVYHATIPEGGGVHCCAWATHKLQRKIGRASCRERV